MPAGPGRSKTVWRTDRCQPAIYTRRCGDGELCCIPTRALTLRRRREPFPTSYQLLPERKRLEHEYELLRRGRAEQARARIVGLCDDMCPLFEMHEREYRGSDVAIFEMVRSGLAHVVDGAAATIKLVLIAYCWPHPL